MVANKVQDIRGLTPQALLSLTQKLSDKISYEVIVVKLLSINSGIPPFSMKSHALLFLLVIVP